MVDLNNWSHRERLIIFDSECATDGDNDASVRSDADLAPANDPSGNKRLDHDGATTVTWPKR